MYIIALLMTIAPFVGAVTGSSLDPFSQRTPNHTYTRPSDCTSAFHQSSTVAQHATAIVMQILSVPTSTKVTSAGAESSQLADKSTGDDLSMALSVIEALAGIASVVIAITVYKLMTRKHGRDANVNPDVEMDSLATASTTRTRDLTSARAARPDLVVRAPPMSCIHSGK